MFQTKTVLRKLKLQKVKPTKYRDSDIYPMADGMEMAFLDDSTLLFGDGGAIRGALDARDGYSQTLDSNPDIANLIGDVEGGSVWSILDQKGTQNMMLSALGDASRLADQAAFGPTPALVAQISQQGSAWIDAQIQTPTTGYPSWPGSRS